MLVAAGSASESASIKLASRPLRPDATPPDELIGFVAAEANHEPNRRRQQRLDVAFDTLNNAAQTADSG